MEEDIIFRFEIDQEQAIKDSVDLSKELDRLIAKQGELDTATEEGSIAYAENAASIRALKKEQQGLNKTIDDSIVTRTKEIKSIDQARANVRLLTKERNSLDITTEEGAKKQALLNAEIDKNNKFIKTNVDAYQQQKIGIGQYREGIVAAAGDLKIFGVNMNQVKAGLEQAKKGVDITKAGFSGFDGVIKASAIGVLLLAVTGIIAAFQKFDPLVDKVEQGLAALGAVVDVFTNRLIGLGKGALEVVIGYFEGVLNLWKAIGQFATGDWNKAADTAAHSFDRLAAGADTVKHSFDGMGNEMVDAAKQAAQLTAALQDLEDQQTAQILLNAEAEQQIGRLLLQSKNRTLSESARLKLIKEAGDIERANFEQNKKLAEEEYRIALEQYALKSGLSNKELELLMRNAEGREEIEAKAGQLDGKEIKRLTEMRAAITKLETDSINLQEKLQNRRDQLVDQEREKREKALKEAADFAKKQQDEMEKFITDGQKAQADESKQYFDGLKKRREAEDQALQDWYNEQLTKQTNALEAGKTKQAEFDNAVLQLAQDRTQKEIELEKQRGNSTTALELEAAQNKLAIKKNEVEEKQKLNEADIASATAVANSAQQLISAFATAAEQGGELQKAIALTNVGINLGTAIGNLVATTSAPSPDNLLTGGIAGFVKYAAGLTQILTAIGSAKNIIGGAAAGGGEFMTKGPTMMLVGDNPGGREKITVEPIGAKGKTVVNPKSNLMALAGGGTVYADGGAAVSSMSSSVNNAFNVKEMVKNIPAPVVRITDLNKAQNDYDKTVRASELG